MTAPGFPVLWIDPGKMTGLAVWSPGDALNLWSDEFEFIAAGDMIESVVHWFGRDLRVGWEHFHVHAKTPGDDAHHAMEMIGVARRISYKAGLLTLKPAQPAERLIVTRQMLEHIGWWRPGKDDAQSAEQHMLAWMFRSNNVPDQIDGALHEFRNSTDS